MFQILSAVPTETAQEFFLELLGKNKDILEQFQAFVANKMSPQPEPHPNSELPWCVCRRCRPMTTPIEQVCCRQHPSKCHSIDPEYRLLCLNSEVVHTALLFYIRELVRPYESNNQAFRLAAYRQYTLHRYGHLCS